MACVQELIKHAHQMGIGVIVSQHDFKKTPENFSLITTMEQMASYGADVCKIAVMPQSLADVARFFPATGTMKKSSRDTFNYNVNGAHRMCEQALRRLIWRICGLQEAWEKPVHQDRYQ